MSSTIKDFESAIAELETIVKTLGEGDLALEKSLELFERGVQLSRFCHSTLAEAERVKLRQGTLAATLRLLRTRAGDPEERAAALVAADELARRLGRLLVARTLANGHESWNEAPEADTVRKQLAPWGVRFGGIGHYSGDLEYDYSLLKHAWDRNPASEWGQPRSSCCSG